MTYEVKLKPLPTIIGIGWYWEVILPNRLSVSDWTITKVGALWSIKRSIKEHKRYLANEQRIEKWLVE